VRAQDIREFEEYVRNGKMEKYYRPFLTNRILPPENELKWHLIRSEAKLNPAVGLGCNVHFLNGVPIGADSVQRYSNSIKCRFVHILGHVSIMNKTTTFTRTGVRVCLVWDKSPNASIQLPVVTDFFEGTFMDNKTHNNYDIRPYRVDNENRFVFLFDRLHDLSADIDSKIGVSTVTVNHRSGRTIRIDAKVDIGQVTRFSSNTASTIGDCIQGALYLVMVCDYHGGANSEIASYSILSNLRFTDVHKE